MKVEVIGKIWKTPPTLMVLVVPCRLHDITFLLMNMEILIIVNVMKPFPGKASYSPFTHLNIVLYMSRSKGHVTLYPNFCVVTNLSKSLTVQYTYYTEAYSLDLS